MKLSHEFHLRVGKALVLLEVVPHSEITRKMKLLPYTYTMLIDVKTRSAPDKLSGRIVGFRTVRYPAGYFSLSGWFAGY